MNQPPQTGKRIVSKSEYVKQWSIKSLMIGMAFAACAYGLWSSIHLIRHLMSRPAGIPFIFVIAGGCALAVIVAGGLVAIMSSIRLAKQIDPGIPLTRANTADLPAPDSLVRASEEPLHEQQAVLLRGARQEQETPPEQLVRATAGPEPL